MEAVQYPGTQEKYKVKIVFAGKFSLRAYSYQIQCLTHSAGTRLKRYDLFVKKTSKEAKVAGETQSIFTVGFFLLRHYRRFRLGYIKKKQVIEKVS